MIKKIMCCFMTAVLAVGLFSACGKKAENPNETSGSSSVGTNANSEDKKLNVIATTFPQYDWAREILGENAEITLLLKDGVDLHNYQPTVDDIAKIGKCDVFIYVGGESDGWVNAAIESSGNKNVKTINLVEILGDNAKQEELVEGMEHDHDHGHEEFDPDNVFDRPLSDWAGDWTTIEKALKNGDLDEYAEHSAEEGEDLKAAKAKLELKWKSEHETLKITEKGVSFGSAEVSYKYAGYKIVESDHGASVWYGFESENADSEAPKFIAFSDHGTGANEDEHEEHEEDEHEDEHNHAPHFHIRYGNESFEALTQIEGWAPTYFESTATGEEIADAMLGHSHEEEIDEHVWLSLRNAQQICTYLSDEIGKLDTNNAQAYKSNSEKYNSELAKLDEEYKDVVKNAKYKTLIFADRFPFRYLADDYGLDYFAAFSGCSAETEASFETIAFLANKLDEVKTPNIMVIENSDQAIAKTVSQTSKDKNHKILVLDSIQSVTKASIDTGYTYLSAMQSNLQVLKEALS